MISENWVERVAVVGNYLPRMCGIATFTTDLCEAIGREFPDITCWAIPVNDLKGGYNYPSRVHFELAEQEEDSYLRAANFLNLNKIDVVCVQHEFGIYGGTSGSHLLKLLENIDIPIVTTLHTILTKPDPHQRAVMDRLATLSSRLVVMSDRGREFLRSIYSVPVDRIDMIPHGIHDVPFVDPNYYKDHYHVEGNQVVLSFGLLSPNKGIEFMIEAMPRILAARPNTVYMVVGATHPALVRHEGERYRDSLVQRVHELGIGDRVLFHNRFMELPELMQFIGAADIYVTPYLNEEQIASGTLAYTVGAGKAVISTPYWYAQELLADGRGVLVPFRDPDALAEAVLELLVNETRRHAIRKKAYNTGRAMVWEKVADAYLASFNQALLHRSPERRVAPTVNTSLDDPLPVLNLNHVAALTDETGMFQHAKYSLPNFDEGYCVDDNARALILTTLCEQLDELDPVLLERLTERYLAFINHSFNPTNKRFRNFMSFNRQWTEKRGSEDSHGRVIWALGTFLGRSRHRRLLPLGAELFQEAIPETLNFTAPRAWAFALVGIHEYFHRFYGDRFMNEVRKELATRLLQMCRHNAHPEWPWPEDSLTYSNGKLAHALILSGRWLENNEMVGAGLRALEWLVAVQTDKQGRFMFVGNRGFYHRGGQMPLFDQQPVDAHGVISACLEARLMTGRAVWEERALRALSWFHGHNICGLPLYDDETGGCCDGLAHGRVNKNQGAESTLAYLLSVAELKLVRQVLEDAEG